MQNTIIISNDAIYQIEIDSGEDAVQVVYKDIEIVGAISLEVYKGDEYYDSLTFEQSNNGITFLLPTELFTGNNIHFRLVSGDQYGEFIHLVYDPTEALRVRQYDQVTCGNKPIY